MANVIIIGILILLVVLAIRSGARHFRGEGGCCGGGGDVVVKRRRLKNVVRNRILVVDGMTCKHCKQRVENSLNSQEHISAKVNLKKGLAYVAMDSDISDDVLIAAVESVGYKVVEVR